MHYYIHKLAKKDSKFIIDEGNTNFIKNKISISVLINN